MPVVHPPRLDADLHPPLSDHEAAVEADRCYFCHDAPCTTACPTGIDIPLFIRQIRTGNPQGAACTIFAENILGGMCARVCPTETLCEQDCVRNSAEDKPVRIGELQRYATDSLMATGRQPLPRAAARETRVAVVGAGPAGLSCAHRLAVHGHDVTVFDARPKPGGLNEYGIASYKTIDDFAQREIDWLLGVGGIELRQNQCLGRDITLEALKSDYDAVFIGIGLGGVNDPSLDDAGIQGVENAVDFIARLRQAADPTASIRVPADVVVIGGGMTAIDAAVQAKLLGAAQVSLVYRRNQSAMNASAFEQQLAQVSGVVLRTGLQPVSVVADKQKHLTAVRFEYTEEQAGRLQGTGEMLDIPCSLLLKAVGQLLDSTGVDALIDADSARIPVDSEGRTTDPKVWAGGDCIEGGEDLTVVAVEHGKRAAESIHHMR